MHCTVAQVGELRTGRTVINQLSTVVRLHRRARLGDRYEQDSRPK